MQSPSELDKLLPEISAIPSKEVKTCPMPIGIYAQEAENLYYWCLPDAESLAKAGLQHSWIEALLPRVSALREAEARWQAAYRMQQEAEQRWAELRPELYKFRDNTIRSFRYALRKNKRALKTLADVAKGNTHADLVQDLATLRRIGEIYHEEIQRINFDFASLDTPEVIPSYVGRLIASKKGDRYELYKARICRDQAYIFLKQAVDEIRECGKYVFTNKNVRFKGYCSSYFRKINQNRSKNKPNTPPSAN